MERPWPLRPLRFLCHCIRVHHWFMFMWFTIATSRNAACGMAVGAQSLSHNSHKCSIWCWNNSHKCSKCSAWQWHGSRRPVWVVQPQQSQTLEMQYVAWQCFDSHFFLFMLFGSLVTIWSWDCHGFSRYTWIPWVHFMMLGTRIYANKTYLC